MRVPNLFTAMADVLAGYLIMTGSGLNPVVLAALLFSTSAIYAGGCILNDLCDLKEDAKNRPYRPLPSGRISIPEAFFLVCFLFGLGILAAFAAGENSSLIALLLILLVIFYNTFAKRRKFIDPLTMASCRAMNLVLGMSPVLSSSPAANLVFPLITFIYVLSLARLSGFEFMKRSGRLGILAGWALVVIIIVSMWSSDFLNRASVAYLCIYAAVTGPGIIAALFRPSPKSMGRAVRAMLIGIPLIDAVYAAGTQGWIFGLPVLACIFPGFLLSRYFSVA